MGKDNQKHGCSVDGRGLESGNGERDLGGDNRKNYAETYREVVTMPGGVHRKRHSALLRTPGCSQATNITFALVVQSFRSVEQYDTLQWEYCFSLLKMTKFVSSKTYVGNQSHCLISVIFYYEILLIYQSIY